MYRMVKQGCTAVLLYSCSLFASTLLAASNHISSSLNEPNFFLASAPSDYNAPFLRGPYSTVAHLLKHLGTQKRTSFTLDHSESLYPDHPLNNWDEIKLHGGQVSLMRELKIHLDVQRSYYLNVYSDARTKDVKRIIASVISQPTDDIELQTSLRILKDEDFVFSPKLWPKNTFIYEITAIVTPQQ